jgi:hypothetical protein
MDLVNASGSVLWGSVSLTALCKNWLDLSKTGDDKGLTSGKPGVTVQVDLYPSSFQVVYYLSPLYMCRL